MTNEQSPGFFRIYLVLIGATLLGSVALAALGYVPTVRMAGSGAVSSMLAGCGVSWLAGCLGALPIARTASQRMDQAGQAILLGTAVRFGAVLLLVVPVVFSGLVDRKVFVIWVAVSYMLLLAIETPLAVRAVRCAGEKSS